MTPSFPRTGVSGHAGAVHDSIFAELSDDAQVPAQGGNVGLQGAEFGVGQVAALQLGDTGLRDPHQRRDVGLTCVA
ncbi:Uncharacterised protein [Mycobacterium tuberculosis]|nr:Uncharacterised protein [Mycobacterium tuberculosis]CME53391.1 Uncharacterised protein [Mycobacterium tuberculosis]CMO81770.1 Uncharacterised protein [Mycobacterium tuberculosis]